MGERSVRNGEAVGSTPIRSTIMENELSQLKAQDIYVTPEDMKFLLRRLRRPPKPSSHLMRLARLFREHSLLERTEPMWKPKKKRKKK